MSETLKRSPANLPLVNSAAWQIIRAKLALIDFDHIADGSEDSRNKLSRVVFAP